MGKTILDACCGSRMFYDDKNNPNVLFMDNRQLETTLCDGRKLEVNPDVVADFRNMPFRDEEFNLVIFDPPHFLKLGPTSWMCQKYGKLNKESWQQDLKQGFNECMRVLKTGGTLVFKWSEVDISFSEIIKILQARPLISHKNNKTYFAIFFKS